MIVGGIKESDDWYPSPRPEATADILRRGFALCPELAPPSIRAVREPTVEDVRSIIIEEGCGLRPARKGNKVRLDVKYRNNVPIVFNIGFVYHYSLSVLLLIFYRRHGGMGYQSSWGTAAVAVRLLEESLIQPMARL